MSATATEPQTYRLASTEMVSAPGMTRWAINGYKFKRDRKQMLDVMAAWPVPREALRKLLAEEVTYTVEGDVVVFTA